MKGEYIAEIILSNSFNLPGNWNKNYLGYINDEDKMQANQKEILKKFNELEDDGTLPRLTNKQLKSIQSLYGLGNQELRYSTKKADYIIKQGIKKIEDEKYNFIKYMANENKIQSKPFSLSEINLSDEKVKEMEKEFEKSSKKNSILFKGVYSFEDEFLEKNHLQEYDGHGNKIINQEKLKKSAQNAIQKLAEINGFDINNINVMGSIHLNTEHTHIHFAICEKKPTIEKGKIKKKAIEKSKSILSKELTINKEIYKKLDNLIKKAITKDFENFVNKKSQSHKFVMDLPQKGRLSFNSLKYEDPVYQKVFSILEEFKSNSNNYKKILKIINDIDKDNKQKFGKSKNNKYKENKIKDLNSKMGNIIIKKFKELKKKDIVLNKNINSKSKNKIKFDLNTFLKQETQRLRLQQEMQEKLDEEMQEL